MNKAQEELKAVQEKLTKLEDYYNGTLIKQNTLARDIDQVL